MADALSSVLTRLLEAKAESDRKNYRRKGAILRRLMEEDPDSFRIDSRQGSIYGITHLPTRFRIHVLAVDVPASVRPLTKEAAAWRELPSKLPPACEQARPSFLRMRQALRSVPELDERLHRIYWDQTRKSARVMVLNGDDLAARCCELLARESDLVTDAKIGPLEAHEVGEPWILIKRSVDAGHELARAVGWLPSGPRPAPNDVAIASPVNPTSSVALAETLRDREGGLSFLAPSPVLATLVGAALGGGLGYGGGHLIGGLLGKKVVDGKRLRRNMTLLGAIAGALPGLWWGSISQREHPAERGIRAWTSRWPFGEEPPPIGAGARIAEARQELARRLAGVVAPSDLLRKVSQFGGLVPSDLPTIPKNNFGQVVWQDEHTPLPVRAMTVGLLEAASQSKGGFDWISPLDIARIGLGAGGGYVSGFLTGKVLSAMAGLTPQAQETLQRTGAWAGLLANFVPRLLR